MKRLIAFDLDGTLAESKQPLDAEMATLLARLSHVADVCIISGGDWPQFQIQVVAQLPAPPATQLSRIWLMPTSGTKLYRHDHANNTWAVQYADLFTAEERDLILSELRSSIARLGLVPDQIWGEQVEDRGSQITFSALGQQAPVGPKAAWDPDHAKRAAVQADLQPRLPGFAVRMGGATSIDVTRAGVDKAYGMGRVMELAGVEREEVLFFGDALFPGGNDAPVRERAGVECVQVGGVGETKRAVEAVVFCLGTDMGDDEQWMVDGDIVA